MNMLFQMYTATEAQPTGPNGLMLILMVAGLILVFYFFMIRPQRKQEKETNNMLNSLQVGDEITTIGGIIGKIVSIKGETCMIETGKDRTKIRILKSAVKRVDVPASVANGGVPIDPASVKEEKAEGQEGDAPAESTESAAPEKPGKKEKKRKKDKNKE